MTDAPRFLSRTGVPSYVDHPGKAMFGEPEALSADALAELTEQAERRRQQARVQAWSESRQRLEREIAYLHSCRFRKDVRGAIRALERQVSALGRKIDG